MAFERGVNPWSHEDLIQFFYLNIVLVTVSKDSIR